MIHTKDNKIDEIIAKDFLAALVFEKYDIDYCTQGNRILSEVCDSKSDEILSEINNLKNHDFYRLNEWEPDLLCDYIKNIHHEYLKKSFSKCISKLKSIVMENRKSEDIQSVMKQIQLEFEIHIRKVEKLLFPYIKKLSESNRKKENYEVPPFGSVLELIKVIKKEHSDEAMQLKKLIDDFRNEPVKSNQSDKKEELYMEMKELLLDFHYHIHLENNMLFPKTIALEKKLKRHFKINNQKSKK